MHTTEPESPFSQSRIRVTSTSPFSVGLKVNFVFIHTLDSTQMQRDCDRLWWGERTASYQPVPDQQSPVISELEIHRASSNKPRPWSSSHRITSSARQNKYAYSNLLAKGSFKKKMYFLNLYVIGTGTKWTKHMSAIRLLFLKPNTASKILCWITFLGIYKIR